MTHKYSKTEAKEIAQKHILSLLGEQNKMVLAFFQEDWSAYSSATRELKWHSTNLHNLTESLEQK